MSRPRERRETGEQDLFRARLDQIINMNHELVWLAHEIDCPVLEARFGAIYSDGSGMPPLSTQLMAGLAILKHTFDLSDEALCAVRPLGGEPVFSVSSICAARPSSVTTCRSTARR